MNISHHITPCPDSGLPASTGDNCLVDSQGRRITYLRLSITDRCNLRCRYCRPEQGVPFIPHQEILRFEEMERLATLFCSLGIRKVRVTGGEPFSRRGSMVFLGRLKQISGVQHLHITTNGVKTSRYLGELHSLGIDGINLSLDTLDPTRFWSITRRNYLESVLQTVHGAIARNIPLKINSVILADTTDAEIIALAGLIERHPITLRFIERMPFSGTSRSKNLENNDLLGRLTRLFPTLAECSVDTPTTARIFDLPGCTGKLGVIQGYSRKFCATCNKVRITPTGMLKTCLYDNGALDLKQLMRCGASDTEIREALIACVKNRFVSGHEAELQCSRVAEPSMAVIGG